MSDWWITLGLFMSGIVLSCIGWLLIRVISNLDGTISKMENVMVSMQDQIINNEHRITVLETVHKINGCDVPRRDAV